VLATYCEKCHGATKQKGKLRVDSVAALLKGGADGAAMVPGSPEQSSIVQRMRLDPSNDDHMPPAKEKQPSRAELQTLAAWVRSQAAATAAPAASVKSPVGAKTSPGSSAAVTSAPVAEVAPAASASQLPPAKAAASETTPPAPAARGMFGAKVQPILREKCGKCHIKAEPAGGLAVDQVASLLEGGYSGAAVVPKDRRASVLMQRLVSPVSDDEHMPPTDEPALSSAEIELIGAWIDRGAPANESESPPLATSDARAAAASGGERGPQPLAAQAGGCAACSVPGAPRAKWLELQTGALLGALVVLGARRRSRA
jgi:uncharacterized membrane protein